MNLPIEQETEENKHAANYYFVADSVFKHDIRW